MHCLIINNIKPVNTAGFQLSVEDGVKMRSVDFSISFRKKAQISIEFMFIYIIFMAALSVAAVYVFQNSQNVYSSQIDLKVEELLSLVKGRIDTAFLEGDGFSTNITLPYQIVNSDYLLNVSSGLIFLEINNRTYSKILLSGNVSGHFRKGENRIYNRNGEIVIS
ncbi:MAG: hypothetical protein QXN71_00245 [Candidatus Aenigmatarchaeota archaeon]